MNAGDKGIRISLRAPEPKAKIEKESHTILQRARQARKRRRTVVEDTEEENDDGDDGFENGEIKESQDVKRKTVKHTKLPAKRRAFRTTRAAVKVAHVDEPEVAGQMLTMVKRRPQRSAPPPTLSS